jgi:hypothetical protein
MSAISAYVATQPITAIGALAPRSNPALAGSASFSSPASRADTGFDPTPVGTAPAAISPAVTNMVSDQFGSQMGADFATASGGGAISDALSNGVAKIAAFAQNGMKRIEGAIQADMAAGNGQVDPGKLQQYSMQMSNYEMMNQLAAKIQEKQEASIRAWLR